MRDDEDGPVVDGLGRDGRSDVDRDSAAVGDAQVLARVLDLVVVELEQGAGNGREVATGFAREGASASEGRTEEEGSERRGRGRTWRAS